MSNQIFDIFVRQYGTDAPILAVTIDSNKDQLDYNDEQCQLNYDDSTFTIYDLKLAINKQSDNPVHIPQRQQLYHSGVKLELDHKPLADYGIKAGSTIHLFDKGIQVPMRLGKLSVYLGPPLIFSLYSWYHQPIFEILLGESYLKQRPLDFLTFYEEGQGQRVAKGMIYFHFAKLALETILVHHQSGMMISLNRVMWQHIYYYFMLGTIVGMSVYHPAKQDFSLIPDSDQEQGYSWFMMPIAIIWFVGCQIMNLLCHIHFADRQQTMISAQMNSLSQCKNLESKSRRSYLIASVSKLVILNEHGFSLVTSADYLWELLALLSFTLVVQTYQSYLFFIAHFVWRNSKAQERHWCYIAEYRREYPSSRRPLAPYVL